MSSNEDGAGRVVKRLNQLVRKIAEHGEKGIPKERFIIWAHRNTGLKPETIREYVSLLEANKEIKCEYGKLIFLASEYV